MDDAWELLSCAQREVVVLQRVSVSAESLSEIVQRHAAALSLLKQASGALYSIVSQWDAYDDAHKYLSCHRHLERSRLNPLTLCTPRIACSLSPDSDSTVLLASYFGRWLGFASRASGDGLMRSAVLLVRARCERLNADRVVQRYNLTRLGGHHNACLLLARCYRRWLSFLSVQRTRIQAARELDAKVKFSVGAYERRLCHSVISAWQSRLRRKLLQSRGCEKRALDESISQRLATEERLQALVRDMGLLQSENAILRDEARVRDTYLAQANQREAVLENELRASREAWSRLQISHAALTGVCKSQTEALAGARSHLLPAMFSSALLAASHISRKYEVYTESAGGLGGQRRDAAACAKVAFLRWELASLRSSSRRRIVALESQCDGLKMRLVHSRADWLSSLDADIDTLRGEMLQTFQASKVQRHSPLGSIVPRSVARGVAQDWSEDGILLNPLGWSLQYEEATGRRVIAELESSCALRLHSRAACGMIGYSLGAASRSKRILSAVAFQQTALQNARPFLQPIFSKWVAWVGVRRRRQQFGRVFRSITFLRSELSAIRSVCSRAQSHRSGFQSVASIILAETHSVYTRQHHARALLSAWFHFWIFCSQRRARHRLEQEVGDLRVHCRELERVIARALETHRNEASPEEPGFIGRGSVSEARSSIPYAEPSSEEAGVCDGMLAFSKGVNQQIATASGAVLQADTFLNRVEKLSGNSSTGVEDDVRRIAEQVRELMADSELASAGREDF